MPRPESKCGFIESSLVFHADYFRRLCAVILVTAARHESVGDHIQMLFQISVRIDVLAVAEIERVPPKQQEHHGRENQPHGVLASMILNSPFFIPVSSTLCISRWPRLMTSS